MTLSKINVIGNKKTIHSTKTKKAVSTGRIRNPKKTGHVYVAKSSSSSKKSSSAKKQTRSTPKKQTLSSFERKLKRTNSSLKRTRSRLASVKRLLAM